MTQPTIAYVGMTHLGLCSAAAAASKGFPTIAFAADPDAVAALSTGRLPVREPGLDELIQMHGGSITFTSTPEALARADVLYVAPDVPTDDEGNSDLGPIRAALDLAIQHGRADAAVVVLSQVTPGFTRSRLVAGRHIFYQVETLIFGRAVERATQPERFIVGCADPAQALPEAFAAFLRAFKCPVLPMRFESAELAKIAINFFLVSSVTTANTLAEVCENIGADWSEIVPALRLDRRIGPFAYLTPGLGISGGNLERDLATVLRIAKSHPIDVGVIHAWAGNSLHRKGWSTRVITAEMLDHAPDAQIAVLGLAYKENTHSIKNSPAIACLNELRDTKITVFDPAVSAEAVPFATMAASALECARGADALMILTPWPEFRDLSLAELATAMAGRLIIDPYRVLKPEAALAHGFDYITLGMPAMRAKDGNHA